MKIKNRWFFAMGILFWIIGIFNSIAKDNFLSKIINFGLAIIFTALSIKEE